MNKILNKNIKLFYIINFLEACIFTTPIWVFFFTSYLRFSFWWALFLMVLSWIVSFILEIPSWAWADRFGRKKMFLLWILFMILSFIFYIFSEQFYLYIISSILMWIWYAVTSWNFEALIHDNLEENWEEKRFKDISSNQYIAIFLWRAFSSSIAWFLFIIHPVYPVIATISAYLLILIWLQLIHEPKQYKSIAKNNKIHIKEAIKYLIKHKILLIFIFILSIQTGLSNIYWFTYQPYLKQLWYSIEIIWIIFAITWIFSALWSHIIKKIQWNISESNIINIMLILLLVNWLLILSFNPLIGLLSIILISITFGFTMPLWNNYLIKNSPKTHKSTILSIYSFWITIWYISFAIPTWYLVDYIWLYKVYLWVIWLILITLIIHYILAPSYAKKEDITIR